jgi:hypothetical protein
MKQQSQAAKNGSRKAAASQAKNTPNPVRKTPDPRAGEKPIPGGITLIMQDEHFKEWQRVECGPTIRAALERVHREKGMSPQAFVQLALENKINASSFPNTDLERTVNASVALLELLELLEHYVTSDGGNLVDDVKVAFQCGIAELCSSSVFRLLEMRDSQFAYNKQSKGGAR